MHRLVVLALAAKFPEHRVRGTRYDIERMGYIASSRSFKLRNAFHFLKEHVWDVVVGSGSFTCCFESNEFDS
ncbi:hypothetical protein BDA96_10G229500 [Sorghum bicolor]|uniref:Uncharacterized protein n=1 Tax=Sorghum bicolor TaxID=4558 RepID=A0A921Q3J8_SORBI|nr:hypothetical protein BDA96_10G229500 [Sorghum bicolor]